MAPWFSRGTKFLKSLKKRTAALHHQRRNNKPTKAALSRGVTQYCRITNKTTNKRFNSGGFVRIRMSSSASRVNMRGPPTVRQSLPHVGSLQRRDDEAQALLHRGAAAACRSPAAACSSCWGGGGAGWETAPRWVAVPVWRWGRYVVLREENNSCKHCCWISQLQEWWLALTFDLRIHLSFRLERGHV